MTNPIVPDQFPSDNVQFIEKPCVDPWEELRQWVADNVPGVDIDKFTEELIKIKTKQEAELQALADPIIEEAKHEQESVPDDSMLEQADDEM